MRLLCPTGRMIRAARGLLLLLSGLVVMVTIVVLHRMDGQPGKFSLSGVGARSLQQLKSNSSVADGNLSSEAADLVKVAIKASETGEEERAAQEEPVKEVELAAAAAEVLSPEEALPEEMIPDQESPAVVAKIADNPPQPEAQQPPVAADAVQVDSQQQEHAQQQDNLKVDAQDADKSAPQGKDPVAQPNEETGQQPAVPAAPDTQVASKPATVQPAVNNSPLQAVTEARKPIVRIVGSPTLAKSVTTQKVVVKPAEPAPENPSVVTRNLYVPGHRITGKNICPDMGQGIKLLILVTTAPAHKKAREAVRGTWGHVALRQDVAFAFFVGVSKNNEENQWVEQENKLYGDMIQGNFMDTYNNLTLKTISMLEWSHQHCNRVQYVLKTDDDMYIHMPMLFNILNKAGKHRRTIMGKVAKRWKPIRNTTSKYYISPAQFRPALYPDFNTGPAYILTSDIIGDLYKASLDEKFFKLEDVYVTGMIAGRLKIQHVDYPQFYNRRLKLETCAVNKLVSVHMVKPFEMYDLWKRLSDGLTKCI